MGLRFQSPGVLGEVVACGFGVGMLQWASGAYGSGQELQPRDE